MTGKKVPLPWDGTRFMCPKFSSEYRSGDKRNMKRHYHATFAYVCNNFMAGFNRKRNLTEHEP